MLLSNDKITISQLQILLMMEIFGAGITALPRIASEEAGRDGWLGVLLAAFAAVLIAMVMCLLCGRFPGKGFTCLSSELLSKPVGKALSFLLVAKLTLDCALELRIFGEIVRQSILSMTPFAVVCGCMLIISAFAASKGYETRARLAEILIFVAGVPILLIFGLSLRDMDYANLLPVLQAEPFEIIRSGARSLFSFSGLIIIMLSFPYLRKTERAGRRLAGAIAVTGGLMTVITALTIARFGQEGVTRQLWPVLEMMDSVTVPGSFIDRQDALMMSFWIISIFAVISSGVFFISVTSRDIVGNGTHLTYVLISVPIIFVISFIPSNIMQIYEWIEFSNRYFGTAFLVAIPFALLALSFARDFIERGRRKIAE